MVGGGIKKTPSSSPRRGRSGKKSTIHRVKHSPLLLHVLIVYESFIEEVHLSGRSTLS